MLILDPKIPYLPRLEKNENLSLKMSCVTFMCLLTPNITQLINEKK